MVVPQKIKQNYHKIQQFHFWVNTKKKKRKKESKDSCKYLHTNFYSSLIYNSQKVEAT